MSKFCAVLLIIHNYFDNPIIFKSVSSKILDPSSKLFFPCKVSLLLVRYWMVSLNYSD